MPIFWRYLGWSYLRVLGLAVSAFVAVLLVSRFKDIARFAALSYDLPKTLLFTVYQVPLILPIAIPISALIASFLLAQRLSRTHEITAFRAAALRLRTLLAPLLIAAGFLALVNFSLVSSVCPAARRATRDMLYSDASENPLILLQRQKLVRLKAAHLDMQVVEEGRLAQNLVLIAPNTASGSLHLISARELEVQNNELIGRDVALITHLPTEEVGFAPLIVENEREVRTAAPYLSALIKKKKPPIDSAALNLRMLALRANTHKKSAPGARIELLRRLTLSLAPLTFTLLGFAFGLEQRRTPSRRNLLLALALTLLLLLSFTGGKSLKSSSLLSYLGIFTPHLLALCASLFHLRRISRGLA